MDSLNTGNKQMRSLYGSCLQQEEINTYKNKHAIVLHSCFPTQYFNNQKAPKSMSFCNNDTSKSTNSFSKTIKTLHEVQSEHRVHCIKTDLLYHEILYGETPEYMGSRLKVKAEERAR